MSRPEKHVFVCGQTRPEDHPKGSCGTLGAGPVFQAFSAAITAGKLFNKIALTQAGCFGPCHLGANVLIYPDGVLYSQVKPEDVAVIVDQHLLNGEPVKEKLAPAEVW